MYKNHYTIDNRDCLKFSNPFDFQRFNYLQKLFYLPVVYSLKLYIYIL